MAEIERIADAIQDADSRGLKEMIITVDWEPKPATRDEALRRVCNLVPVFERRGWRLTKHHGNQVRSGEQQWWKVYAEWAKIG